MTSQDISKIKKLIEERKPLIHCITNVVTVNDCANVLLALGASPTMAHHPKEVAEVASFSSALVLNMGTTESIDAMITAGKAAKAAGKPIVLDPVGAGGASFRRDMTIEIIRQVQPDCIRGNVSEIMALCNGEFTQMGVDAHSGETLCVEALQKYSSETGVILVVSGATDYIISGDDSVEVSGGSAMMSKITGAGCMASSLLGAFLSVEKSVSMVEACCKMIKECAKRAEDYTYQADGGPMYFRSKYIDEIFKY